VAPYAAAALLDAGCRDATLQFRLCLATGALPPLVVLWATWGAQESDEFKNARHARRLLVNTTFGRGGGGQGGGRARARSLGHVRSVGSAASAQEEVGGVCCRRARCGHGGFIAHLRLGFEDAAMGKHLGATALCWLLYDVAYYGSNVFTPTMTEAIFGGGGGDDNDDDETVGSIALQDCLATAVGIPAVLHALWVLRRIGTKRLQVWGFLLIAATCAALAAAWTPLQSGGASDAWLLFACYLAFVGATNWGPNVTTFVLPQEVFAVEVRATFNGLAAASGKTGAVIGIWIFDKVNAAFGMVALMAIIGVLNLVGAAVSQVKKMPPHLWFFKS
jgi:hypothetical protein